MQHPMQSKASSPNTPPQTSTLNRSRKSGAALRRFAAHEQATTKLSGQGRSRRHNEKEGGEATHDTGSNEVDHWVPD